MTTLLTGASGFLGGHIFRAFSDTGKVITLGRRPVSNSSDHITHDLSQGNLVLPDTFFDKVIHCAGKAHVFPKTKEETQAFYDTNEKGTQSLLQALDKMAKKPRQFVLISTVAVYGIYQGKNISETQELKPNTPYGISKLKAEKAVGEWCRANQVECLILRLPLIVGIDPPGNLGDMKKAIAKGYYVKINGNTARKSIVVAEDVAALIKRVEGKSGIYHLTDGEHPSFHEIESAIAKRLEKKIWIKIPLLALRMAARVGDAFTAVLKRDMPISSLRLEKITSTLTFEDSKARKELNWNPKKALKYMENHL